MARLFPDRKAPGRNLVKDTLSSFKTHADCWIISFKAPCVQSKPKSRLWQRNPPATPDNSTAFGEHSLTQIPKFVLVLVVVLRPRCAGVCCSAKSPIVPQLFCSVILIVSIRISAGEAKAGAFAYTFTFLPSEQITCPRVSGKQGSAARLEIRDAGSAGASRCPLSRL